MLKFLSFIFLIQFAHWSMVRGAAPTEYTNVKTTTENALKNAAAPGADVVLVTCDTGATGTSEATKCRDALKDFIAAADNTATNMVPSAGAAYYYLTEALLMKDATITGKLDIICANMKRIDKCYSDVITACTDAAAKATADPIVYGDKATLPILYYWQRFCLPAGTKNPLADKFLADTNKYAACKDSTEGAKVQTAIEGTFTALRALTTTDADMLKFVSAPTVPENKKQQFIYNCKQFQAANNKGLATLFSLTLDATACPAETQALMFENLRREIPPGIDKACTLTDPATTFPTERPNPSAPAADRKSVGILSFQHVLGALRTDENYVTCKDVTPPTNVLLLEYLGNKIEGDFKVDVTDQAGFPLLEKVVVTLTVGTETGVLTLENNVNDFPAVFTIAGGTDSATFKQATLEVSAVSATVKNAKITDKTSGFIVIIDKVVVGSQAVFAVTVRGPTSIMNLLGGGMMYVGCLIENPDRAAGDLAAMTAYDKTLLDGSEAIGAEVTKAATAVTAADTSFTTTTTTTASSDSCFVQASLSFILITVTILKMFMM